MCVCMCVCVCVCVCIIMCETNNPKQLSSHCYIVSQAPFFTYTHNRVAFRGGRRGAFAPPL